MIKNISIAVIIGLLQSCASVDSVMFVTKTSLSVAEADSKPAGVSVAYDRIEGYIGPRYDNGAVPPVFASIKSDGEIFNPDINQLYATGDAARLVAGGQAKNTNDDLSGDKKLMFFGTSTTTGFKISTTNNVPDSAVLGYRRKEFSYIPLGTDADGNDVYPAVIASIRTEANISANDQGVLQRNDLELANSQFFATGGAAVALAPELRNEFQARAEEAISQGLLQEAEVARALRCYMGLEPQDKQAMWQDAAARQLYTGDTEDSIIEELNEIYGDAVDDDGVIQDFTQMALADQIYASSIYIDDESDRGRIRRLEAHRAALCATVEKTRRDSDDQ